MMTVMWPVGSENVSFPPPPKVPLIRQSCGLITQHTSSLMKRFVAVVCVHSVAVVFVVIIIY